VMRTSNIAAAAMCCQNRFDRTRGRAGKQPARPHASTYRALFRHKGLVRLSTIETDSLTCRPELLATPQAKAALNNASADVDLANMHARLLSAFRVERSVHSVSWFCIHSPHVVAVAHEICLTATALRESLQIVAISCYCYLKPRKRRFS